MLCSEKFGLAYVVSKMGLLFVYSVDTLAAVYRQRISADPVFLAQAAPTSGGVYVITRRGSILQVDVSRDAMVCFLAPLCKQFFMEDTGVVHFRSVASLVAMVFLLASPGPVHSLFGVQSGAL